MPISKEMIDEFEFDDAMGIYKDAVAVYFVASGTELLGQSKQPYEPAKVLKELKRRKVKVIVHSRGFPGYPYFEILIALFPAGMGLMVLKGVRDLVLAWLQGRREREVEITLPNGVSVRMKGSEATAKTVKTMVESLLNSESNEGERMKKGTSPRAAKAASKVLRTSTSVAVKRAAASALTQSKAPREATQKAAAKAASKVLLDGRSSKAAKTAAASTLAQTKRK
jgi:hypothetical protein